MERLHLREGEYEVGIALSGKLGLQGGGVLVIGDEPHVLAEHA